MCVAFFSSVLLLLVSSSSTTLKVLPFLAFSGEALRLDLKV